LFLTILSFIAFSVLGTMTEKGEAKILGIIILLSLWTVGLALWKALTFLPNEKSVTVDKNTITLNFPLFKKAQTIDFKDINYIRVREGHEKSESIINIKTKENVLGLSEDVVTTNSITSNEWKEIAKEHKLPLIIHRDIEEKVIEKRGLFGTQYLEGDDYYVIRKSFDDKDLQIDLNVWNDYVKRNSKIKALGQEEFINVTEEIQKEPKLQYSLQTEFGNKGLDFFEGLIVTTYEKGKKPVEIEQIADDLRLGFKNIVDIK
jgi:hypothetical protein